MVHSGFPFRLSGLLHWPCQQLKTGQLSSALELPQTLGWLAVIESDSRRGDEILVGEMVVEVSDPVVPGWLQPEPRTLIPCHAFQTWFQARLLKHHLDL